MIEVAHVEVELDGRRHRLRWPSGQTLIDLLLQAGSEAPHSCQARPLSPAVHIEF
jgi:ferredoxin